MTISQGPLQDGLMTPAFRHKLFAHSKPSRLAANAGGESGPHLSVRRTMNVCMRKPRIAVRAAGDMVILYVIKVKAQSDPSHILPRLHKYFLSAQALYSAQVSNSPALIRCDVGPCEVKLSFLYS